ncbi:MarR family winged helix-turn-helix transcriptional regulator [Saccharopolyspora sp. ASAGF58]|uniref:MarR family winged helix-turn-helix transcriptional regulator n=1 Tax=Saccharopolyspora sp. ASAGF58 TaxID=2719023 RepID=UPI00143FFA38|nr:MarR family transcriptional regulator [Saccharopolyspora sp. ASAGF58]QIZ38464.1 MarR family transcriptional regulator [Saccharopolyspora sp. ASAGF58]
MAVSRLRRRLKELTGEGDLTPAQASVPARLDKDGAAPASELAAGERVRPQSMATIVAALERAELVDRHPDLDDGRRQLVTLTEVGPLTEVWRERRAGSRQARQAWLARTLQERCTEEQRLVIIDAMALLDDVAQS